MPRSDADKIKSLEKALEISASEIIKLNATCLEHKAQLNACKKECLELAKRITVLNTLVELDRPKTNGRA
jgi:hypothetical protein